MCPVQGDTRGGVFQRTQHAGDARRRGFPCGGHAGGAGQPAPPLRTRPSLPRLAALLQRAPRLPRGSQTHTGCTPRRPGTGGRGEGGCVGGGHSGRCGVT